ncbi:MAG: hypothetical protein AAF384_07165 [Pseudomonadota bacterium]
MLEQTFKVIDKVGMPHVMSFMSEQLREFNTNELEWIKLLPLNKKALLHGACHFPFESAKGTRSGYRIRASVNVDHAPPFRFEHWGRVPSTTNKRGWVSGEQTFFFDDLEQCAVHTLSHECFHFLAATGQTALQNIEANANWWADQWLKSFQSRQD